MSIPITCSGCRSAFDVPDTLAGKTIRCTACKAQMAVPEEIPVAVIEEVEAVPTASSGGTKKPFGSGSQVATKAAAPSQSRANEPSAAKSSPNGKAPPAKPAATPAPVETKAAAKPTTKAVVADVDDDEEEEKATKSKPAKAADKKIPAKKRRDDDDDDDDEDEKPTRKKKKQQGGGSGKAIAAGGGGLGTIVLIIIIIVLRVSRHRDRDDSERDSTSNTINNATTNTGITPPPATPNPATPNPATPNPGTPNPGNNPTGLPPAPGMPPTGMNPIPGMPAIPAMPPDGMNPIPGMPSGPPLPGMPPAPGMPPGPGGFGGNPFAKLDKQQYGTPGDWAAFTGDGFTAEFAGTPEAMNEVLPVGPPVGNITCKFVMLGSKSAGKLQCVVGMHLPIDPNTAPGVGGPAQLLNAIFTGMKKDAKMKMGETRDVTVDGYPGKEADVDDAEGKGTFRIVLAKNRIYFCVAVNKAAADQANGKKFLDSIKITYKGGDQLVALPGMGPNPGMFPGQPAVPQGKPANTDGNQKVRLDAFLTASFDLDKKDLFTVELRQTPRGAAGLLHWYTYPNFSTAGFFHLSHIGFRSTIDSKAGLLYVAYTTNAASCDGTPQERLSGVGSIAVYDLNAIREKKTPDGKPLADGADLKPVGTITLATRIYGMELSEDGKSLYVLVTPTGKKAGALWLVDTEKRTVAKRFDVAEPVRDLVRAGDGKNLLILENDLAKGKYGVTLFDVGAWSKIKTTNIPKAVILDVAPMTDGSMIVSALALNQPGPGVNPGVQPPVGMNPGVGAPPGIAPPIGGIGGPVQPQPGQPPQPQMTFRHFRIDKDGVENGELDFGVARRVTNGGYIKFDTVNKKFFTSSYRGQGLDVYDVVNPAAADGMKLKTAIRTAKGAQFGGHFFVTPDGKYLAFQQGAVIDTADIGGELGTGNGGFSPPGLPPQPVPPVGGVVPSPVAPIP